MKPILVKIFLVLNLLLCSGALAFGIILYRDRQVVSARKVILRNQMNQVAEKLEWGMPTDWETAAETKDSDFSLRLPTNVEEIESFEETLQELAALAETRITQLTERYDELIETRQELADTKETLATRVRELETARSEIANLENQLSDVKGQLADARRTISTLESENSTLRRQIQGLEDEIETKNEELSSLETRLARLTLERDRVQDLLAACQRKPTESTEKSDWYQKTAKILAVDPDWNYVVINKGEVDVLPMFLEAIVHRGDEYIGKIRVAKVERTVALAEILSDTLIEGKKIRAGDTIFF